MSWARHAVSTRSGFGAKSLAKLAADLRTLKRVGEPGTREIARVDLDHLGLGREPAQRGTVQHARTVPLEGGTPGPFARLGGPSRGGPGVVTGQAPLFAQRLSLPAVTMAARPASSRATGTRNGEQDT